ncbi:hypothetical protein [Bradyrhizobium sp. HKCCYLS20291]
MNFAISRTVIRLDSKLTEAQVNRDEAYAQRKSRDAGDADAKQ